MPASRSPSASVSKQKTQRSSVSAAFPTSSYKQQSNVSSAAGSAIKQSSMHGSSAAGSALKQSSVQASSAGGAGSSVAGKQSSFRPSSPGSGVKPSGFSVVGSMPSGNKQSTASVGTITDPYATAPQILATGPSIKFAGKSPSSALPSTTSVTSPRSQNSPSSPGQPSSSHGNAASGTPSTLLGPSQDGGTRSSTAGSAIGKQASGAVASPPQSGVAREVSISGKQTSQSQMPLEDGGGVQQAYVKGTNLIDLNSNTGAIVELVFSVIAFFLYLSLYIFLLSKNCTEDEMWVFLVKAFSLIGVITSVFLMFHSCFDKKLQAGRGLFGCVIFFIVTCVVFVNIVGAFYAQACICQCSASRENAFKSFFKEDLTIFILELLGSICLVVVLIVSSVMRDFS